MSNDGDNIVYGSSAAIAFLTAGAMQCHENGMAAVRAAREERELDQLRAFYEEQIAQQAALIDKLRAELEKQRTLTEVLNDFAKKELSKNKVLKETIARKNEQLSKLVAALDNYL